MSRSRMAASNPVGREDAPLMSKRAIIRPPSQFRAARLLDVELLQALMFYAFVFEATWTQRNPCTVVGNRNRILPAHPACDH